MTDLLDIFSGTSWWTTDPHSLPLPSCRGKTPCSPAEGSWLAPCATPQLPRPAVKGGQLGHSEDRRLQTLSYHVVHGLVTVHGHTPRAASRVPSRPDRAESPRGRLRQVWINKDTKVICQGMTGRQGTFHTTQARCDTGSGRSGRGFVAGCQEVRERRRRSLRALLDWER